MFITHFRLDVLQTSAAQSLCWMIFPNFWRCKACVWCRTSWERASGGEPWGSPLTTHQRRYFFSTLVPLSDWAKTLCFVILYAWGVLCKDLWCYGTINCPYSSVRLRYLLWCLGCRWVGLTFQHGCPLFPLQSSIGFFQETAPAVEEESFGLLVLMALPVFSALSRIVLNLRSVQPVFHQPRKEPDINHLLFEHGNWSASRVIIRNVYPQKKHVKILWRRGLWIVFQWKKWCCSDDFQLTPDFTVEVQTLHRETARSQNLPSLGALWRLRLKTLLYDNFRWLSQILFLKRIFLSVSFSETSLVLTSLKLTPVIGLFQLPLANISSTFLSSSYLALKILAK